MRVLVCGGRDFDDFHLLDKTLDQIDFDNEIELIIQGGAIGADFLSRVWAKSMSIPWIEFSANWNKYGKKAGPIRNQQMLDEGKPDLVVAFPTEDSVGTWDMVKRATEAGIEVQIVKKGPD